MELDYMSKNLGKGREKLKIFQQILGFQTYKNATVVLRILTEISAMKGM